MEKKTVKNPLINKRVVIQPIKRKADWGPVNDRSALHPSARTTITGLLYNVYTRSYVDPLIEEEKEFFYSELSGLNLEPNSLNPNSKNCMWRKFKLQLPNEPVSYNLADAMDYLRFAFLKSQKEVIAPSVAEQNGKLSYKFVIVDSDIEVTDNINKISKEKEVNRHFYSIENDEYKLRALLKMYLMHTKSHRKVPEDATQKFLTNEVYNIIKSDVNNVYEVIQDKNFSVKLLVYESIDKGLIIKSGSSQYQITGEEDVLNLKELIEFLLNPKNQHVRLKLESATSK